MGPGDFVHKVLISGIAFTAIAAVLMMGIAYIGYSSEVMHANARRIMSSGLLVLFLIGGAAVVMIFFPHLPAMIIDSASAFLQR
jgi:hypothetical protein